MKFIRTEIPDVVICQPDIIGDSRGYFTETFREDELTAFLGYKINFCQDNESKSAFGVLRGLHYQLPPFAQTKLVRVIEGRVLDIAVDIRKGSDLVVWDVNTGNAQYYSRSKTSGFTNKAIKKQLKKVIPAKQKSKNKVVGLTFIGAIIYYLFNRG